MSFNSLINAVMSLVANSGTLPLLETTGTLNTPEIVPILNSTEHFMNEPMCYDFEPGAFDPRYILNTCKLLLFDVLSQLPDGKTKWTNDHTVKRAPNVVYLPLTSYVPKNRKTVPSCALLVASGEMPVSEEFNTEMVIEGAQKIQQKCFKQSKNGGIDLQGDVWMSLSSWPPLPKAD